MPARRLSSLAAAAVLVGCAAPDAVAPQEPVPSVSVETKELAEAQTAGPTPEPLVTTTSAAATTLATSASSAEHESTTTTKTAPTTSTATALAPTITAATATSTTTTVTPTTTTTPLADPGASSQNEAEPVGADNPDDPDGTGDAYSAYDPGGAPENSDDPAGQAIDAAGATAPAVEEEPSQAGADTPAVAAPGEVTPYRQAVAAARRLAPGFVVPNDCRPPPLDSPYSMPNAPRAYRSGVHAGVDFLCSTAGHPVVSVLDGQVVVAAGDYRDPTLQEWNEILAVATALGSTPDYTLAMLSGRYVVVDHGIIDDVGHVVSLYAHLDAVDPGIGVGMTVVAGQRLGGIGNTGTRAGVIGDLDGQLHLHWNFYVDGQYLGAGLSESETRDVYAELFKYATGTEPQPEPGTVDAGTGIHAQDGESFAPRPGPAGPGTLTPSGHRPLDEPISLDQALEAATRLSGDIVVPSDCQAVPLRWPSALPNAPRAYRSGTHQGVDFGCARLGQPVVAALAGRVVMAVGDFEDPSPQQRSRLLDTAAALGATPAYTLVMLYGNYVAVDHGIIDGVGHVVSLYAHLDGLDTGIRPGLWVEAGQSLGTIGNSGTYAGASRSADAGLHLHWELHIDGHYLGIGLPAADTRAVYTALFTDVGG